MAGQRPHNLHFGVAPGLMSSRSDDPCRGPSAPAAGEGLRLAVVGNGWEAESGVFTLTTVSLCSQSRWVRPYGSRRARMAAWPGRGSLACRHGYKCVALMVARLPDLGSQMGSQRRQTSSDSERPTATIHAGGRHIRRQLATARDQRIAPEKRKVGGSTPPLTTKSSDSRQPSHLREPQEEREMPWRGPPSRIQDSHKNPQRPLAAAGRIGPAGVRAHRSGQGAANVSRHVPRAPAGKVVWWSHSGNPSGRATAWTLPPWWWALRSTTSR
jgi:hypothetical protein